jgi:hypothetical protein
MFRVLAQDGFAFRMVDPQSPRAAVALGDHLRRHVALALIVREETNGLHWIVIDRNGPASAPQTFVVVDPLDPEPRTVTEGSLFTPRLVSLVLIAPAEEPSAATLSELHAAGLREMARVRERAAAID